MNVFQRKNSKKVKDADGSQKKDGGRHRGKHDLFDRAKGGLDALADGIRSAKNDAEAAKEKLQGDVKSGIGTVLQAGSGILHKAKAEFGKHSEATSSTELEQGSEEQGTKNMEAFKSVLDKVKTNPEVLEKVKGEVVNLAEALHLTKHESTSTGKTEDLGEVQHAVEEIQAAVTAVQQQQTVTDEAGTEASTDVAAAETSDEGEKPEAKTEVEKDDPTTRIGFLGFFAMLFERCCSPANKKKDD